MLRRIESGTGLALFVRMDTPDAELAFALMERGACWFVRQRVGSEEDIRALLDGVEGGTIEERLDRVAKRAAVKAALRAFLTSTFASPWTAIPLGLVDLEGASSAEARIAAATAYVANERFFENPRWDREVLLALLDVDDELDAGVALTKSLAKRIALTQGRRYLTRTVANTVPFIGGAIGAAIELAWLTRRARQLKRRFEVDRPRDGATPEELPRGVASTAPAFDELDESERITRPGL
ncbi:MAG: hypothetical protein AB7S26_32075 [Sandaracinaceae bacterium]